MRTTNTPPRHALPAHAASSAVREAGALGIPSVVVQRRDPATLPPEGFCSPSLPFAQGAPAPVCLTCGCKINLSLRITGRRSDGYHELDSLFWPIAVPHDTLHITPLPMPGIQVQCATPGIDCHKNTLTKAYAAFTAMCPVDFGLSIILEKGIPHGAGLGGGSADAALVLRYCQRAAAHPLAPDALTAVAVRVGADVPFFLYNVPARVQGIGERITPVSVQQMPGMWGVLVCPRVSVSTPWAYAAYDSLEKNKNTGEGLTSGREQDTHCFSEVMQLVNDLEPPVFQANPLLAEIKATLLQKNAVAALMSGSGSTVFGLYADEPSARAAEHACNVLDGCVFTSVLQHWDVAKW